MNIEIHEISDGHAHGAIWLDNGTALPVSMPAEAYETAVQSGFFTLVEDLDALDQINMDGVIALTNEFLRRRDVDDRQIQRLREACQKAFDGVLSALAISTEVMKKSDE